MCRSANYLSLSDLCLYFQEESIQGELRYYTSIVGRSPRRTDQVFVLAQFYFLERKEAMVLVPSKGHSK